MHSREDAAAVAFFEAQLDARTQQALAYLPLVPVDSMAIPRSARRDGRLNGTPSKAWTSGFYPGVLWLLYEHSDDERLKTAAMRWTQFVEKEKHDTHTHDLGFKVYCSFGQGHRITSDTAYRQVILDASRTLIRRYHPRVGCIRSWDFNQEQWQFPVIIDNMMNLEMLFEATRLSGDSVYYHIAYQHALTTLANHIRPDHSSYHVIDYDTLTGAVRHRHTHQGLSHESAWARGQAWNLYGFAMAYRETGDPRFLVQARAAARYMYEHPHMPGHGVPYWDFDATNIPNEPLDASAAAVAAAGLLVLGELDPDNRIQMLAWADRSLTTLSQQDFISAAPPFLLDHSVGSIPGDFEVDVPIIYADYYYVEALMRRVALGRRGADVAG
ncbi:MAG: glycoside hydrolase family 88 protein [Bacteroidia bacterium]